MTSFVPSGRDLAFGRHLALRAVIGGHWMVIGSLIQTWSSGNYYSNLHRIAEKLDTRKIQGLFDFGTFDCRLRNSEGKDSRIEGDVIL